MPHKLTVDLPPPTPLRAQRGGRDRVPGSGARSPTWPSCTGQDNLITEATGLTAQGQSARAPGPFNPNYPHHSTGMATWPLRGRIRLCCAQVGPEVWPHSAFPVGEGPLGTGPLSEKQGWHLPAAQAAPSSFQPSSQRTAAPLPRHMTPQHTLHHRDHSSSPAHAPHPQEGPHREVGLHLLHLPCAAPWLPSSQGPHWDLKPRKRCIRTSASWPTQRLRLRAPGQVGAAGVARCSPRGQVWFQPQQGWLEGRWDGAPEMRCPWGSSK